MGRTTIELKPDTKEKIDRFRENTFQESLSYDNTIQQILSTLHPSLLKKKEDKEVQE